MYLFELTLQEERKLGRAESILDLLSECGEISEEVRECILRERNLNNLKKWLTLASKVDTVEQFINQM